MWGKTQGLATGGGSVRTIGLAEDRLDIPAAVQHPNDRYAIGIDLERHGDAPLDSKEP
jgi:hypothetical protein